MDPRALAQQLGLAIRETPEFRAAEAARARVEEHEAARLMLLDFRQRQDEYGKAVVAGKAHEEQAKELRGLAELIGHNPYVRELLSAEANLANLVLSLQSEIMTAAGLAEAAKGELETDGKGD